MTPPRNSQVPSEAPPCMSNAYRTLETLLTKAVEAHQSRSALITGPRGSGKSLLVRRVLRDLNGTAGNVTCLGGGMKPGWKRWERATPILCGCNVQ